MSSPGVFLWPNPIRLTSADVVGAQCPTELVEAELRRLFPDCEPVLFSSARAGLTAVLATLGLSRPDLVWTSPYSSHCVLEAIAHVSTPVTVEIDTVNIKAALVYHQWGHIHRTKFASTVRIIEDSVDSLLMPGRSPFAVEGDFVLWSLQKVLATQAGGVIFCKRQSDADELRGIRGSRGASILQSALRLMSKSSALPSLYWNGAEAMQGELISPFRRQVLRRLKMLDRLVEDRRGLLRNLSPSLHDYCEKAGRIPSNIPLRVFDEWKQVWGGGKLFSAGLRNFNVARTHPAPDWIRAAPLPLHIGVSQEKLWAALGIIGITGELQQRHYI
jgi:putative PLP-dependent aminotransferase (TIGR04422 family)